jgi:hypothetical protein
MDHNLRKMNTYKFIELRHAESTLAKKYPGGGVHPRPLVFLVAAAFTRASMSF